MNRPVACALIAFWGIVFGSGNGWSQTAAPQSPAGSQPVVGATHYDGWYTFNGNLENQKISQADQITPQNVGKLQKVWEVHTGDVSDGSGKIPLTDWSATPLFVNDTVYVRLSPGLVLTVSAGPPSQPPPCIGRSRLVPAIRDMTSLTLATGKVR